MCLLHSKQNGVSKIPLILAIFVVLYGLGAIYESSKISNAIDRFMAQEAAGYAHSFSALVVVGMAETKRMRLVAGTIIPANFVILN